MSVDFKWLEKEVLERELSPDERTALECIKISTFTTGQTIISQSQPGGTLYILRSGSASVEDNNAGERVRIANVTEGTLFGEMSFLSDHLTTAEVIANEACVIYKLSHDDFSKLMQDQQHVAYSILVRILASQASIIQRMNAELLPIWHNLKKKAEQLPLLIKLIPIIFTLLYFGALAYVSFLEP